MVAIAEVVARIGSDKSKAYLDVHLKLVSARNQRLFVGLPIANGINVRFEMHQLRCLRMIVESG